MKKFSRMPRSESGGLGGASGSGCGVSSYFGKVFAVGRYQVTVEELIAEGTYRAPGPAEGKATASAKPLLISQDVIKK